MLGCLQEHGWETLLYSCVYDYSCPANYYPKEKDKQPKALLADSPSDETKVRKKTGKLLHVKAQKHMLCICIVNACQELQN